MTDVNVAFAEQRAGQVEAALSAQARLESRIAKGEMKDLGGGRYEVLKGYDRGEVFTMNKSGLLLPQHGLDESTGSVALYAVANEYKPVWHSAGNLVPEGITGIDTVLKLGGIDFSVGKRLALMDDSEFGEDFSSLVEVPGWWVTYRSDTMAPLACVGNVYRPFQNREAAEFLEDACGTFGLTWDTAGALRGGRKVFVSVEVPEGITIDPAGAGDHIRLFLIVINSHDGSCPVTALVSPWRPVCGNTERLALKDAVYKWTCRHTTSAPQRYEEARRSLGLTLSYAEAFKAEEEKLVANEMLMDEFRKLTGKMFPRNRKTESAKGTTQRDEREEKLADLFAAERSRVGSNAYAAERAFTGYWDNVVTRYARGGEMAIARATAVIEDTDARNKGKVHKMLMNRVK
jgi:phage/plasmid-like protein (TIGR03299 family)